MKKIIILIITLCFTNFYASAQLESQILKLNENKNYYFDSVYVIKDQQKNEIYSRLKEFIIRNSKGQNVSNFFDDENKNTISANPNFVINSVYGAIDFKLNISIKDGKYRIQATSFILNYNSGASLPFGHYDGIYCPKKTQKKVLEEFEGLFQSYLNQMEKAAKEVKKNDWENI